MLRSITPEMTIVEILRQNPAAEGTLSRLGIDNCCGGHATLAEHCRRLRLDAAQVICEIAVQSGPVLEANTGPERGLHEQFHHTRDLLGRVVEMSRRVGAAHGARRPELAELERVVEALVRGAAAQIDEFEHWLLPHVRSERTEGLGAKLAARAAAQRGLIGLLEQCRDLTAGFSAPGEACGSWRRLVELLAELDEAVRGCVQTEQRELSRVTVGR